jgi:hypothetical protein
MPRIQHTLLSLPNHKKCFAMLSNAPQADVKRAVVFIHGFNGSAKGTWTDFLSLVDDPSACSDWWEKCDLFFFHYQWESVFQQLMNNMFHIYEFVDQIFPTPHLIGRAYVYRERTFQYDELVIAAHSEGGLLTRMTIIEAAQRDNRLETYIRDTKYNPLPLPPCDGMLKAKLRLFAPALGGDMQTGLVGVLTSLPGISNFLTASAAKKGMNPGSSSVTEARDETTRYAEHLPYECFRAHVVFAEKDLIVANQKYREDMHCRKIPVRSTHTSVCKPKISYCLPLDFVEKGVAHFECR